MSFAADDPESRMSFTTGCQESGYRFATGRSQTLVSFLPDVQNVASLTTGCPHSLRNAQQSNFRSGQQK